MSRCEHCGGDDHSTPNCPDPKPVLLPCPFCGSHEVRCCAGIGARFTVECQKCETTGPRAYVSDNAVTTWNIRAGETEARNQLECAQAALRKIATMPLSKEFERDEHGEIAHGANSYGPAWAAWNFQEIAKANLSDELAKP